MRRRLQVIPDASSMELPFLHPGTVRLLFLFLLFLFCSFYTAPLLVTVTLELEAEGKLLWPQ